jgi:alkylhydroperoxidase family enzyme
MMEIPRLRMEELAPDVAAALQPRVQRLGYLGEFFKCTGHQPRALLAFMQLTDALKDALPDRITEVVALTVACTLDNRYERHQHERLCRKLGYADDWILAVRALEPSRPELSPGERAAQVLTLSMLRSHGHASADDLAQLTDILGPAQAIAVMLLVGRYATHSMIVNALQLQPPVDSIFAGAE